MRKTSLGLALAVLTLPLVAQQIGQPGRIDTGFDVMLKQNGIMDIHTMEELDQRRHEQLGERSQATLSQFDLKAPGKARNAYNKGLQFLAHNDTQNAIDSFTKALAAYPNFVSAYNALGSTYFNLKKNDLAREQFLHATGLDSHVSASFVNLGRAELALGNLPAAQAAFEKASSVTPLDAKLLLILAYVQFQNHDYVATVHSAEQAHNRPHPGTALVHYFSAASWQAQNRLDQTQTELQTFLNEDPTSPFADGARQALQKIQAGPVTTQQTSISYDTSASLTPSYRGLKALQELRQKQQIAEAEAEGSNTVAMNSGGPLPASPHSSSFPAAPSLPTGGWTLHTKVEEVAVYFTATDHGKSVTDLTRDDIALLDDQKPPAALLGFHSQSGLPLRLGLLIDTSDSITDRFHFEQTAAANFMRRVLGGKDDTAFVAGFSNSVVLAQDFTSNQDQLSQGIHQLVPVGGTAVWDAVSFAADKLAQTTETQPVARVLVLISDGDDNSSSATLKEAIGRAERDEVIVYTVSTRDAESATDADVPGNHAMRVLAELTGGAAFFPGSAEGLNHSLSELQQVIRSRYLIAYKPAQFAHDGRYRTIAIAAKKSGHKLKVNSRKGYYTEAPASPAAR
jgi:VWFA-related protein